MCNNTVKDEELQLLFLSDASDLFCRIEAFTFYKPTFFPGFPAVNGENSPDTFPPS